ncbi:MAG TPA: hypothetical protein ENK57_19520 [Polyangiaceae bacterium]|nr:hypothetical protein [Polyangiaceae bacterium]
MRPGLLRICGLGICALEICILGIWAAGICGGINPHPIFDRGGGVTRLVGPAGQGEQSGQ